MGNPIVTLNNTTGSGANGPNAGDGSAASVAKLHCLGSNPALNDWLVVDLGASKNITSVELRNFYHASSSASQFRVCYANDATLTFGASGTFQPANYLYGSAAGPSNQTANSTNNGNGFRYVFVGVGNSSNLADDLYLGEVIVETAATPGQVQSLAVTPGNGQNVLVWQAPASAPSGTFYRVSCATRPVAQGSAINDSPTLVADNINALTYTHMGLTNGQAYYYYVSAVNPNG